MPSPFAHPAAAIPLTRTGLVLSGLIVGSVAPDLGYLLPLSNPYFMNTAAGLILFDVPAGIVLLWLFHSLAKWPLLSAAPDSLQRRLYGPAQGFSFKPPRRFALILLSLLVGSATHVIWDSFTHEWGWMVEQISFLRIPLGGMPLFVVLRDLGTAAGIWLLVYWFVRWIAAAPQSDRLPARFSPKVRTLFLSLTALSLAAVEGATIFGRFGIGAHLLHQHGVMHGLTIEAAAVLSFYAAAYWFAWMVAFRKTGGASGSSIEPLKP